jgi:hypothetical protein
MHFQLIERADLVTPHQAAIAFDVGREDRCKLPFNQSDWHPPGPPASGIARHERGDEILRARPPAKVHWGHDGWDNAVDKPTNDTGPGFHVAALDVTRLPAGSASILHSNGKTAAPGTVATIKCRQYRAMRHSGQAVPNYH